MALYVVGSKEWSDQNSKLRSGEATKRSLGTDLTNFGNSIWQGIQNAWYGLTGQTEKTSAYQAQMEREDNAPLRQAQALEAAGLSKYTGGSTTVGTGTYGDGKSTALEKSIQLASALMDLKTKKVGIDATQAGINKTLADQAKTEAETGYINNQNANYKDLILSEITKNQANALYNNMYAGILESQSPFVAEKCRAEIDQMVANSALHLSQSDYYQQLRKTEAQNTGIKSIERNLKQKDLEKYEFRFNMEKESHEKQMESISESIAKSIAERNHLSKQDQLLVKDTAYKALEIEILRYNYDYSSLHGLRTTDSVSRFMGLNVDAFAQVGLDNLKGFWNYNGLLGDKLGLPSFNDLIPLFAE